MGFLEGIGWRIATWVAALSCPVALIMAELAAWNKEKERCRIPRDSDATQIPMLKDTATTQARARVANVLWDPEERIVCMYLGRKNAKNWN